MQGRLSGQGGDGTARPGQGLQKASGEELCGVSFGSKS